MHRRITLLFIIMTNACMKSIVSSLTIAFILLSTRFFRYVGCDPEIASWGTYAICTIVTCMIFCRWHTLAYTDMPLSPYVKILMILFLSSACVNIFISENFWHNERSHISLVLVFLFYYLFYIYRISESDIIKIFTGIAVAIFFIQLFQIIFPQAAVFGTNDSGLGISKAGIADMRNGIYRFRLETYLLTLFCLYYYWNLLCIKINPRNLVLFSIFLASLYLYLTRQIMVATVIALGCSYLFIRNTRIKNHVIILIGVLVLILSLFFDDLFGELFLQTKREITGRNIRFLSVRFYWNKICENPLTFLFGSWHPEFLHKQLEKGLYPSDIGFIGEMFHYGILWIIFYFYSVYIMLVKYRQKLPLYIKLFVLGTFTNSIMIFPYRNYCEYFVWVTMLYLASMYIGHHKNITYIDKNN